MNPSNRRDLFGEIEHHPGTRILNELRAYGTCIRILGGNSVQLRMLIKTLEDPADPAGVQPYDRRSHCHNLLEEVVRLFHNFLSSVSTLIDHTRNLMKRDFIHTNHATEYQTLVNKTFATDPFAKFIQDFRDYVTHRAIPIVGLTTTVGKQDDCISEIEIDLKELAKWRGWTAPSRTYIATQGESIRLLKLVDDYEAKVKGFNERFGELFNQYYEPQITPALTLMREWNERLRQSQVTRPT
jgi:hypothetical protein